jgi:sortase A
MALAVPSSSKSCHVIYSHCIIHGWADVAITLHMGGTNLKRRLGWVEYTFYLAGVALLAVFFQIRADGERKREEGVQAFRAALNKGVVLENPGSDEPVQMKLPVPNMEHWADKRVAEYEQSLKVEAGPPLAVMTIGKLDIQVPVYDGADDFNLNRGVARIRGTATVDADGNLGIAGHRDGFFRGLKDIALGDRIELQTGRGEVSYAVSSIEIVEPSDVSVLAPTPERTITLVTCYPFYYVGHAPKRYIVKAKAEHLLAKT